MNLSVLTTDKEKLLNYMREQHFSENYVARHNQMSHFIVKHMAENAWCSFSDIYYWVEYQPYTKRYAKDFLKILRNLEFFHSKGFFPGNGSVKAALKEIVPSCGQLDLVFLQKHLEELFVFMRANDYGEDYISLIHNIANRIILLSRTIPWDSYFDIWKWYQSQNLKPSYLKNVLAALGILEAFHLRNEMPNNRETQNMLCKRDNSFNHLNINSNVPLDLHAHQFRHARASHWLEEGINIVQISRLLGHAHLQTTMIYLDITTEQEALALATLEDETVKNTVRKWNLDKDTLSALCGLRKLNAKT